MPSSRVSNIGAWSGQEIGSIYADRAMQREGLLTKKVVKTGMCAMGGRVLSIFRVENPLGIEKSITSSDLSEEL